MNEAPNVQMHVVWIRYGFYILIRVGEIGVLRDGSYYE